MILKEKILFNKEEYKGIILLWFLQQEHIRSKTNKLL